MIERAGRMMFAWCRAFLGGFGLSVGEKKLSDEGEACWATSLTCCCAGDDDVDPEGDEESLTEIEEYAHGGIAAACRLLMGAQAPATPAR